MNYLITAAGRGTRYLKNGIKPPKPLIRVYGLELILWSLRSFQIRPNDTIIIAYLAEHNLRYTS